MKPFLSYLLLAFAILIYGSFAPAAPSELVEPIVFGRDVMPILGQRCFKCHGPDAATVAAGLRLDSAQGAKHVIRPGSPSESLLIERVSAKNPRMRMPPDDSGVKPLTTHEVEVLTRWIKQGARYEKHWSFIPPKAPALPKVRNAKWAKNAVDLFVLAKLEGAGFAPEPEADRNTLALRAAQTLTGMPPSVAELERFRLDKAPGAYERYVDRMLAKPAYGEHQARYWLDAVRYGDTHGLQLDNERGIFPYRDWVVRAFNEDLPYSKFVEWQLAGDLLPNPSTDQLVATGYVRMNLTSAEGGAIEEEFLARNTFDRVDTTSTVMLGLTVQCAKCHDHKYDPIKERDYYGLYAFFNSTTDSPLDGNISLPPPVVAAPDPEQTAQLAHFNRSLAALRASVDAKAAAMYFEKTFVPVPETRDWQISPTYRRGSFDEAYDSPETAEPGQTEKVDWQAFDFKLDKNFLSVVKADAASVYVRGTITFAAARSLTFGVSSDDGVKVWLNGKLIHENKVTRAVESAVDKVRGEFRAGDNELVLKIVNGAGPDGLKLSMVDSNQERVASALASYRRSPSQTGQLTAAFLELGPASATASRYRKILSDKAKLEATIPMSLVAKELPKPRPTFILKRGQYDQRGDRVVRRVPVALGSLPSGTRADRLSFANWLTSSSNPLVSRVFVNRIWQQHFGTALVKTAEDFGTQGEWPLNQPLLDYLAVTFRTNGWSIKKLNRMIVTSAAFRQSSRITKTKLAKDPENRLISRGPRFRLDAEVIRDKALLSGGLLTQKLGGRGFKPYQPEGIWELASDPASQTHFYIRDKDKSIYKRSLYLFWKRTAPPPNMLTFDAPLRDTCVVRRSVTNTPLQALTMQNETAFLEAARTMAHRILLTPGGDDRRISAAFNVALSRPPKLTEIVVLKKALAEYRRRFKAEPKAATSILAVGDYPQATGLSPFEQAAWMILCSTLMNTDEFLTLH